MKEIRLVGGPGDGKVYTVNILNEILHFASVERVDMTQLGDMAKTGAPLTRKSAYHLRKIASTGHPVHNPRQQVLFDWIGDS